jgi:hypothetical protein
MKKQILALVPLVFCFAAGIEAAPILYVADLGNFENPPTGSGGTGFAAATLDVLAHTLTIDASFTGLTGLTTVSHIHCCVAEPGNAGVATRTPTFLDFPVGVTAGSYFHIYDTTLASSFNPAFITANGGTVAMAEARLAQGLADGRAYFNIHTNRNPGGEIRGFLALPEPGTLGLIVLGLGTLATATRKRRA